jgi:DNA-binding NtrC family response regulator
MRGSQKILIADNDEDVLIALEHVLETGGYATATAFSPDEAAQLLGQGGFDLCVLDDYLSEKDSVGLLAGFREVGKGPLVVVTYNRFPLPHLEKQFRMVGVSAFVNKRAHSELFDIVSQLLQPALTRSAFDEMT